MKSAVAERCIEIEELSGSVAYQCDKASWMLVTVWDVLMFAW